MLSSDSLFNTTLFQPHLPGSSHISPSRQAEVSYLRAEAIAGLYNLSTNDIAAPGDKFWDMHTDPITCFDGAATTLLTIQLNLVAGTLASYGRPDLTPLIDAIVCFKTIGQFCLTEIGHGLDAFNMQTTATLVEGGCFVLNTPVPGAAKFMPPTIPVLGRPCVGIVFAQLLVDGVKRGVRPFIVPLNDGYEMHSGISARLLPYRGASMPVNHSVTSFDHVRLGPDSLLGDIESSGSEHHDFLMSIWRVSVGGLALSSISIPALKIASYIALKYSLRRTIRGHDGVPLPIISFRTQHLPIAVAVAKACVLEALHKVSVKIFSDNAVDPRVQHGISTATKAVMVQHCQSSQLALSERCGAQGLFDYNQFTSHHAEMRGIAIAEGDILVLSIRLATELMLGRYSIPPSSNPDSLLYHREMGLLQDGRAVIQQSGSHRSHRFSTIVVPQCQKIVESIGHRMAYDAAVASGVPNSLVELYVSDIVKNDMGWYTENQKVTGSQLAEMEDGAMQSAFPNLESWVDAMQVSNHATSPLVTDHKWQNFLGGLRLHSGGAAHVQARL